MQVGSKERGDRFPKMCVDGGEGRREGWRREKRGEREGRRGEERRGEERGGEERREEGRGEEMGERREKRGEREGRGGERGNLIRLLVYLIYVLLLPHSLAKLFYNI